MTSSGEIDLSRRILSRIDTKLRSELDQEKGEWLVKVPASRAVRAVWKRYCDSVGVPMGHGLAVLLHNELASIVDEDVETLSDRLDARETELEARTRELKERDKELTQRDRVLFLREADLSEREKEVAARGRSVAAVEHRLAQEIMNRSETLPSTTSALKLGRNEPCWCGSEKKFKYCHGRGV
jgi:prefoldin subunit 5